MGAERYNHELVGRPGSRAALVTPCLVVDLDAFEANLEAMAAFAKAHRLGLRPHAKTHKCAEIARRQLAAGALGICCAKLGEAEALVAAGIGPILITAPVADHRKLARLAALAKRSPGLAAVVDDGANLAALAEAVRAAGSTLEVVVDVDVGLHRTGVDGAGAALALAQAIAAEPALRLGGIQGYGGHLQHIEDADERAATSRGALVGLAMVRDALRAAGLACPIVTGGGTGTHDVDAALDILTELQVGSYIFSDTDYERVGRAPGGAALLVPALSVATRVVSARHGGFATTDAGTKCFGIDGPPPRVLRGPAGISGYAMFGDQFGRVSLVEPTARLELGALLEVLPPHCDPTVNLYDVIHAVRGDRLEAIWPIEARGATD